jgi:flagellar basal-body rod modification protein FlgD
MGMFTSGVADTTGLNSDSKAAVAKEKMDKDLNQFLNMLVAQLKNQDPLDPLDANAFTQQLVQFASVEQQIYSNANLEKLVGMQQTSQVGSMVNYLGNYIEAEGSTFNLENGLGQFSYDLESKAVKATLTIQDAFERPVWTGDVGVEKGKEVFHWDGVKFDGTIAPDGPYTAIISAKDIDGNLINVAQTVYGRVTGAGAENGVVSLSMGAVDAPLDRVLSVRDSALDVPATAEDAPAEN